MLTEYDERVKDWWKKSHGTYVLKMVDDEELEDEIKNLETVPLHLGAFVLSNSKRILINFLHAADEFYTNGLYYSGSDSLYIENKH